MKHLKPYKIFENSQEPQHPGFPTTEEEIHKLCKKYNISNYTINEDLSIDVNGNVDLLEENLEYLPLNFNYINGLFSLYRNCLVSLKGSPNKIEGDCIFSTNELDSLEFCPKYIGSELSVSNNKLTSLKGIAEQINGGFDCGNNNIMSLEYLPKGINYNSIHTDFRLNPIYTIVNTFIGKDNAEDLVREFNDYDIVRGDTVVLNRLKVFCSDFNLKVPDLYGVRTHYTIV